MGTHRGKWRSVGLGCALALAASACAAGSSGGHSPDKGVLKKITLSADRPLGDDQANEIQVLTARLKRAGVHAEVGPADGGRVQVVANANDVESIRLLLTARGHLAFRKVAQQSAATSPSSATGPGSTAVPFAPSGAGATDAPAPPPDVVTAFAGLTCPAVSSPDVPDADWTVACDAAGKVKYLLAPATVTGADVLQAKPIQPSSQVAPGQSGVDIEFTPPGQVRFTNLTEQLVGQQLAIAVDNVVQSAPTINERIAGSAQISGGFDSTTASRLAAVLSVATLPAPLHITSITGD
jgi:preprotein translocase subunit SecD